MAKTWESIWTSARGSFLITAHRIFSEAVLILPQSSSGHGYHDRLNQSSAAICQTCKTCNLLVYTMFSIINLSLCSEDERWLELIKSALQLVAGCRLNVCECKSVRWSGGRKWNTKKKPCCLHRHIIMDPLKANEEKYECDNMQQYMDTLIVNAKTGPRFQMGRCFTPAHFALSVELKYPLCMHPPHTHSSRSPPACQSV